MGMPECAVRGPASKAGSAFAALPVWRDLRPRPTQWLSGRRDALDQAAFLTMPRAIMASAI